MTVFPYNETEINHLKSRDKKLAAAIDKIGYIEREANTDLFASLINAIVGQQISAKAHATVWQRIVTGLGSVTPETILACTPEQIQAFGVSHRKASYIHGTAARVADGSLNIDALHGMSDDEVCKELSKLPGIGVWTAEMIMLFSMHRPDILSFGDLAILRGMATLYRHRKIKRELFEKYRRRYSPYGSTASLYLWAIAAGALDE